MEKLSTILQIIVALSVFFVWTIRIKNVIKEFELFGISDVVRSIIGATKIALSTMLILGIWHPDLVFYPSLLMCFFMLGAQFYHYKIRDLFVKYIPSLILLIFSIIIVLSNTPY